MKPVQVLLIVGTVLLWIMPSVALAQTGKIAGMVTDASSGEPLPGVNIIIDGTTIGAVSDVDGFYAILNVSPGTYDLRASFIGYTPAVIEGVEVQIDLTTEVDIPLQEETVGLDEVIVTAGRPIIQRDISGSQRNISSEEVEASPYQNITSVITAQVGVNDVASWQDEPSIRGSSLSESKFLVDGVEQGDVMTNRPFYRINLDAVEQIKVQTGGFSAEYGDVRSGLISIVTKEGGDTYSGSADFRYSPPGLKHFGPMMFGFDSPVVQPFVDADLGAFTGENNPFEFEGWNQIAAEGLNPGDPHYEKPMELYARWLWRHRSPDAIRELKRLQQEGLVEIEWGEGVDPDEEAFHNYGIHPDYNIGFTLGGPVPLLESVKFFASYNDVQTEYASRTPDPTYNDREGRLKLTTRLGKGLKLNLHGMYGSQRGMTRGGTSRAGVIRSNPYQALDNPNKLWYPHCQRPGMHVRQIYGANLTHTISANTFYEVNFSHHRHDYYMIQDRRNTVWVEGSGFDGTRVDFEELPQTNLNEGLIGTTEDALAMEAAGAYGWEHWRDWAKINIGGYWYDEAPEGHVPSNWRDITGYYRYGSCPTRINDTKARTYQFKTSLTSQVGQHNQIKAGVQVRYDDLFEYVEWFGAATNRGEITRYDVQPWRGALFAQDKVEYKSVVANIGLRADWMVHGKYPVLDGAASDTVSGPYSKFLLPGRASELDGNVPMRRVKQLYLSPRFGISYPITTVAKVFFNYGHFYQWPEPDDLYRREIDKPAGEAIAFYGNPLAEPPRTIAYELGYEHNLFDRMNLRMTAYYKDINNELIVVDYHPLGLGGDNYGRIDNRAFRDIRGLETFLELRRNVVPFVSGWASVNYMVSSGAEFGFDEYYEDPNLQPELANTQVSNPDTRPIIKLNLDVHTPDDFGPSLGSGFSLLGGINASLLYMWQRGEQFTWNPAGIPYVEDNVRWVPYQRWDLRFRKSLFSSGRFESVFYVDVINLFNNRNMTRTSGPNEDRYAWDGHKWWNNEFESYMHSLGYTDENEARDGSFDTELRPGDWKGDDIDLPAFTPWLFLERRDVYFGIKLYF